MEAWVGVSYMPLYASRRHVLGSEGSYTDLLDCHELIIRNGGARER